CNLPSLRISSYTTLFRSQAGGIHQVVHPGTAALALPGVVVADEQAQAGAVRLEHLPHPHPLGVAGEVTAFGEGEAVEPGGGVERSEEHTSELQSRFDLVC